MKVRYLVTKQYNHSNKFERALELVRGMVSECTREECIQNWYTSAAEAAAKNGGGDLFIDAHQYGYQGNHALKYRDEDGKYVIEDLSSSITIDINDDAIFIDIEGTRGALLQNYTSSYVKQLAHAYWFDDILEESQLNTLLPEYPLPGYTYEEQHKFFFHGSELTVEDILRRAEKRMDAIRDHETGLAHLWLGLKAGVEPAKLKHEFCVAYGNLIEEVNTYYNTTDGDSEYCDYSPVLHGESFFPDELVADLEEYMVRPGQYYKVLFEDHFLKDPQLWVPDDVTSAKMVSRVTRVLEQKLSRVNHLADDLQFELSQLREKYEGSTESDA